METRPPAPIRHIPNRHVFPTAHTPIYFPAGVGLPCLGAGSQHASALSTRQLHRLAGQDQPGEKTPNPSESLEQKPIGHRASADADPVRRA